MSAKQLVLNAVQDKNDTDIYQEPLYMIYAQMEIQKGIGDMEQEKNK